ncbi:hypothetical protein [Blastococcus mobilis]|uniref:Uncharacterized protein n=1 Tax=Blastococcus mobilis TaxID=1938746 RepID=A0A238VWR6_9ACTN|nr:hypothetical protein [Blastococcus mobilis]SNR38574.1 hypothetical protein SAMN06272737_105100 [Blastococcus mobilis]
MTVPRHAAPVIRTSRGTRIRRVVAGAWFALAAAHLVLAWPGELVSVAMLVPGLVLASSLRWFARPSVVALRTGAVLLLAWEVVVVLNLVDLAA